jgi:hypothetical protein
MKVDELIVADLEALLEEEVPCGGIRNTECFRECNQPGTLRWTNPHNCPQRKGFIPTDIKCVDCWMLLYRHLAIALATHGGIICIRCDRMFRNVLAFTDYGPF